MKRITVIVAALLIAGCGGENGQDVENVGGSVEGSWSTVEEGNTSQYGFGDEISYLVVRDQATWSFLYRWTRGQVATVPSVDFNVDIVGSVFLGTQPSSGYSVAITDVQRFEGEATYYVETSAPGPKDLVFMALTNPYAFARFTSAPPQVRVVLDNYRVLIFAKETTFAWIASKEFGTREQYPIAASGDISSLVEGICPVDGSSLEISQVKTQFVWESHVYYCVAHGEYWVKNTPLPTVDPIPWMGPYRPGVY